MRLKFGEVVLAVACGAWLDSGLDSACVRLDSGVLDFGVFCGCI